MTLSLHWFLPTAGDSRDVVGFGPTAVQRDADLDYLTQVARAAERVGFDAVLTPTGTWCDDAWVTTAALIGATTRLRFLVAFRPGFVSPTLAAQQAVTFQRLSGGRLLLNVVTGGSAEEQRRFGDFADHDTRYDRTAESSRSCGAPGAAPPSTTPARTTGSRAPSSPTGPRRSRPSSSAARRMRASRWRPATRTRG
jgi:alkanesulfonate monooxygenase